MDMTSKNSAPIFEEFHSLYKNKIRRKFI